MTIKFLKANDGDSILLSFLDTTDIKRNILIDGGRPKTYFGSGGYGDLYNTIEEIKSKSEKIDLLILTHIDDDHIGGFKKWFEMDKDAFNIISKVWFNSGRTIANHFGEENNNELNEKLEIFKNLETGVAKAIIFEEYIEQFKVWDKEILINERNTVEQYGLKITILSPNSNSLKKLLKEYKRPIFNYQTSSGETDWKISIEDFINEESMPVYKYEEDDSVANGSSIAFLLSYNHKNYIFLGDAHPSIIINSLKKLDISKENPISAEFLKVSHHGSSKNTNKELLELIKTDNYILSSSSEINKLPNKRTIARIIHHNPNSIFHFNYSYVKENIFTVDDFEKFEKFAIKTVSEWR